MILTLILGFVLLVLGLIAMLSQKNIIKIILGFSIADTGVHLIIVSLGYIKGRTAPIIDSAVNMANSVQEVIDPIPSALVLTAIVIGLATTALMLVFASEIYKRKGSFSIDDYKELKW